MVIKLPDNMEYVQAKTCSADLAGGECIIESFEDNSSQPNKREKFSNKFELDGIKFEEPSVSLFSFNNPYGACPTCNGFGNVIGIDEDLVTMSTNILNDNYPNPFNPSTTISYNLAEDSNVELTIYNLKGQKVKQLVSSNQLSAGQHSVEWNGTDDAGKNVSSGIYLYKLKAGDKYTSTKKMILLK